MTYLLIFLIVLVQCSAATVYQLNGTEYNQLPPLFELDDYRECKKAEQGLYCIVNIVLSASAENQLMRIITEYSALDIHYNHSTLDRGICVTTRCKAFFDKTRKLNLTNMQIILNKCIENSYNDYGLVANVSNIYYCTDNEAYENKNVDLGDFIFGAIIILLLVINGVATFYDVILRKWTQTNKESGNQYLLTFSVIQNWERLIQSGHIDPAYERFASVHGVRSLSSFLTILPHMMLLVGSGFVDNPHDFEKAYYNPFFYIIVNGTMFVQIYFIVSGSLMTYSLALNERKRIEKWGFFFKAILYRWIRLVPSVALLLGFITTWYRHLGSGPLWEFYTTPVVNDCRRYWWSHILLFNNYIEDNKYCLLQSWQIAADYQMYSIALALYLGTKKGRGRSLAHFLLFAIGCIAPALHVWFQNLDGVFILYPEIYRTFKTDNFRKMHVFFYNNLACFAMGLQLGLFVHYGLKNKINLSKYSKMCTCISWMSIPLSMLIFMTGFIFFGKLERPSVLMRMMYTLHRPIFGALVVIGLLTCIFRVEDNFRHIFEWRVFRVPSRLSYAALLVHMNIINYIQGVQTQLITVSFFNLTVQYLGVVWLSFLMAIPIYILVETPVTRILKLCLFSEKSEDSKKRG